MHCEIKPVNVWPEQVNYLVIRAGNLGPPPTYYYQLQKRSANPIPGEPDIVITLKDGNVTMSQQDWDKWPADYADDAEWQLTKIRKTLGLKLPVDA